MSSNDPHPAIKQWSQEQGWGENERVDPQAFAVFQQVQSVLQPPAARMRAIRNLDDIIAGDDASSLKSRAELLNLRRSLSATHHELLKAGR